MEDNGELYTINSLRKLPQSEARREEGARGAWRALEPSGWVQEITRQVGDSTWRAGLRARHHGDVRGGAVVALGLNEEWPEVAPHKEELALQGRRNNAVARHDGVESGQGGRLVGADGE